MSADATQVVERGVALPGDLTLRCRGAGAGPRHAVLLHGFPEVAFVWDATMRALAGEASGLAPSLRGEAGSSAPQAAAAC